LVRSALTNARKYGWIQLDAERQRGRGNHAADAYSIAYPSEIPADLAAFSEEIPARNVGNTGKDCPKYRQETSEIPARPNSVTCENDDPTVLSNGSKKGFERGSGDGGPSDELEPLDTVEVPDPRNDSLPNEFLQGMNNPAVPDRLPEFDVVDAELVGPRQDDDIEPERFCPSHMPDGSKGAPCGGCRDAHENRKEWQRRQNALAAVDIFGRAERERQAAAAAPPKPHCNTCRDTGVFLMSDGRPGGRPAWCLHNGGGRRLFTDQELIDNEELLAELREAA
jgi:hypothetical protein